MQKQEIKVMSIEEKAKAYDEAVAKGKQIQHTPYTAHWDIMKEVAEHLLPELKESEDESIRKEIITYLSMVDDKELIPYESWIAWLEKQGEQEPAWSEEDEMFVHGLIRGLKAKRDIYGHTTFSSDNLNITTTIDWLESLKNRFLSYPVSVKYNEKDIDTIADTFIPEPVWNALEESEGEGSNAAAYDYSQMIAMFKAGVHWLKSLRPQNTWKPSLSQLNALGIVSKGYAPDDIEAIVSLYNDLKKLRNV